MLETLQKHWPESRRLDSPKNSPNQLKQMPVSAKDYETPNVTKVLKIKREVASLKI